MNISRQYTTHLDNNGYIRKKEDVSRMLSSQKLSKNHVTPLKRESINFKGVFNILYSKTKPINYSKAIKNLSESIGGAPSRLAHNIESYEQMSRSYTKTGENIVINEKRPLLLICDSLQEPFKRIPLTIYDKAIKFLQKHNILSPEHKGLFQKQRQMLNNDELLNSLDGYLQSADKYRYDTPKDRNSLLFDNAMKMFNSKTGNYNAVHERALTRIVTGMIPAVFLANDAYNLSRLMDDDPKLAEKEKKTRFNQEVKRIFSNAYLQLITFGALAKHINASKGIYVITTIATVLFTEAYSRLSNGKKLHLISKEEAIEINKKEREKYLKKHPEAALAEKANEKPAQEPVKVAQQQNQAQNPAFKGAGAFKAFDNVANLSFNERVKTPQNSLPQPISTDNKAENKKSKDSEPLISLKGIAKWAVSVIAAGYAIKYGRNIKVNKKTVGEYLDVLTKMRKNLYKKLTEEKHLIAKKEFDEIIAKLEKYDPLFASRFKEITIEHQQAGAVSKIAEKFAQKLKNAGLDELAADFNALANKKLKPDFKNIDTIKAAEAHFKGIYEKETVKKLEEFFSVMKKENLKSEAEEIRKILTNQDSKLLETKNYADAIKKLKEMAKTAKNSNEKEKAEKLEVLQHTFNNKFKFNQNEAVIEMFTDALSQLKKKDATAAKEFENILEKAKNAENYDLGAKNRKYYKEITDFITQPFIFIKDLVIFPYTFSQNVPKWVKSSVKTPTWSDGIKSVSNGVKKLKSKMKLDDEQFKKYMDRNINKAFNTTTMSSISNADLSLLSRYASLAGTAWFLVADNYNMVMLKSNGEDKSLASLKAKERIVQETSRTFYNNLFIQLFNGTFSSVYNGSLLGAQLVNAASTTVGEYVNRKAIGMPVAAQSRDEILQNEHKNLSDPGMKGKFFRFMTRLTGKKAITQRVNDKPAKAEQTEEVKKQK